MDGADAFSAAVNEELKRGGYVVTRDATSAVLRYGQPVSHLLHAFISLFILGYVLVWIWLTLRRNVRQVHITLDRSGWVSTVEYRVATPLWVKILWILFPLFHAFILISVQAAQHPLAPADIPQGGPGVVETIRPAATQGQVITNPGLPASVTVPGDADGGVAGPVVSAGVSYGVSASGEWCAGGVPSCSGPDGFREVQPGEMAVLDGGRIGLLIARIDGGPWFAMGSGSVFTAPSSGQIYFAMNDIVNTYGDNSGALVVRVASR